MFIVYFSVLWAYWAGKIRKVGSVFEVLFHLAFFQIFQGSQGITSSYSYWTSFWGYNKRIVEAKWALEAAKNLNTSFALLITLPWWASPAIQVSAWEEQPHRPWKSLGASMSEGGSPGHRLGWKRVKQRAVWLKKSYCKMTFPHNRIQIFHWLL